MSVGEVVAQRYELLEQIGRGGQALVYRALDRQSGDAVALKMLPAQEQHDPHAVERMAREQQAMVQLAGTSAVGFVDLCRAQTGAVCLVMELLHGQDLELCLQTLEDKGERLPLNRTLEILQPIADTLDKAHAVGIVHRDLKPGNIFLAEPGARPRLLDFGLSRMKSSTQLTALGQVLGSPSYIAPEMWKGRSGEIDHRADVYSFAVILFRMLSGALPFEGSDLREKFIRTTTAKRPSLHALRADLPAEVDAWVARALAIEPGQRFDSAGACFDGLRQALGMPTRSRSKAMVSAGTLRHVQQWLSSPLSSVPGKLTAAFSAARGMLGKFKRPPKQSSAQGATESPSAFENQETLLMPPKAQKEARPKFPKLPPPPPPVSGARVTQRNEFSLVDVADFVEDSIVMPAPQAPQKKAERRQKKTVKKKVAKKRKSTAKKQAAKKRKSTAKKQAAKKRKSTAKKQAAKKKKVTVKKKTASKKGPVAKRKTVSKKKAATTEVVSKKTTAKRKATSKKKPSKSRASRSRKR